MTAYTTNIAIPYPQLTDYVKDGATAMEAIAEKVDDSFTGERGFRNYLINGDFSINQRGLTSSTTNNIYGHDRWRFSYNGTGTSTYSSVAFSLGNAIPGYEPVTFAQLVTTGQTGTNPFTILEQRIEYVRTLAGQQATISFYAKANSGTPKIGVSVVQNFGTGGSPSASVETPAGAVTITTTWTRYTVTVNVPSISGKTLGSNGDHFLSVKLWVSAGTDYATPAGAIGIQTNTFALWGVQVERGPLATPFEVRPIGTELLLCMRYFQNYPYGQYSEVYGGYGYAPAYYYYGSQTLRIPMRATPSTSLSSVSARRGSDAALLAATNVYYAATGDGTYWAFAVNTGGYNAANFFISSSAASAELG